MPEAVSYAQVDSCQCHRAGARTTESTNETQDAMARRYHVSPLPPAGCHALPQEVAHHLARVMRARAGDPVVLFDGAGRECRGEIVSIQGTQAHGVPVVEALLGEPFTSPREPSVEVEAAFALPTGQRSDWLFEHGTEVGIRRFRPFVCARSDSRAGLADQARAVRRHQRWQRICAAAAGQCDRSLVPEVVPVAALETVLASPGLPRERYLAHAEAPALGAAVGSRAVLLVGPPGGFTEDEIACATAGGFAARSLGPLTLRTETAVLAGAVRLMANGRGGAADDDA